MRIKSVKNSKNNNDLDVYTIESTSTDVSRGGTLLYIKENVHWKIRKDIQICQSKELESVFIEFINKKGRSAIVGCINRHPCIDPKEFNETFLKILLEDLSYENKNVILMGDFNIDILQYDTNKDSEHFLDEMNSKLLPYIVSPSRVTSRSKTYNIFSNTIEEDTNSSNITTTVSDRYAQKIFIALFEDKHWIKVKKKTKFQRDFIAIDQEKFELDLEKTNSNKILEIKNGDID